MGYTTGSIGGMPVELQTSYEAKESKQPKVKNTEEQKLADKLLEALDNHWFNPVLFAQRLTSGQPFYTQDKVSELVVEIIKMQAHQYSNHWEHGYTSEGLMMSARLNDMIEAFEPIPS